MKLHCLHESEEELRQEIRFLQHEMQSKLQLQADQFKEILVRKINLPLRNVREYIDEIKIKYPDDDRIYHLGITFDSLDKKLQKLMQ